MEAVQTQARNAGIEVPFISNDAAPLGHNKPGSGVGAVDIYVSCHLRYLRRKGGLTGEQGHDSYPLGFDCVKQSQ